MNLPRDENGQLSAWAWPGGYPIYYIDGEGSALCVNCARKEEAEGVEYWGEEKMPKSAEINYEDTELQCEQCYERIESAYGN